MGGDLVHGPPHHLTPDEFKRATQLVTEWVAGYLARLEQFPVSAGVAPGEIRARLPTHPPEVGEPLETIVHDLDDVILPGIMHWQSPNFFGYFPANASPPAILGELVAAGLGVQGMSWSTSPACTELETHVLDWLVDLLGLPVAFRRGGDSGQRVVRHLVRHDRGPRARDGGCVESRRRGSRPHSLRLG